MRRIQRIALLTTAATLLLISIGGFVRVAGAGLGCESWPKCFSWSWLPPLSRADIPDGIDADSISIAKAWIEYANRLVGVAIGLLIVATWWAVFSGARERRDLLWPATIAVLLVAYQGWFGGQVVKHKLDPRLVSIHLFLAVLIAGILVWIAFRARTEAARPVPASAQPNETRRARLLTTLVLGVTLVQLVLGALVRGTIEHAARAAGVADAAEGTVEQRREWFAQVGLLDQVHRKGALLILILMIALFVSSRRAPIGPRARFWLHANATLLMGQIAAGLALAYAALPKAAQLVHLTLGSWLVCGLFAQWLSLREERASNRAEARPAAA